LINVFSAFVKIAVAYDGYVKEIPTMGEKAEK
jgi:hypothetical protein